ncbi:MAG: cytochrome c oxidase subunit II [Pseudomonadota bacterium]
MTLSASTAALFSVGALSTLPAVAYEGQPTNWQMGMQAPVTKVAREIHAFYDLTNIIIIAIALFVLALMVYVVLRFNERANPTPSKTTHNAVLELVWTAVPALILLVIAIPSFKLLYMQYDFPKADVVVKATGHQWYWAHSYPQEDGVNFETRPVTDEDVLRAELGREKFEEQFGKLQGLAKIKAMYNAAKPLWTKQGKVRLLSVDNEVVVPVNKNVIVEITAGDVIHNWTIPSFGSKMDAVPGRLARTWFNAEKKGVFYGQCSELCGKDHSAMPIAVRVVDQEVYASWIKLKKDAAAAGKARDRKKQRELDQKARELIQAAAKRDAKERQLARARSQAPGDATAAAPTATR